MRRSAARGDARTVPSATRWHEPMRRKRGDRHCGQLRTKPNSLLSSSLSRCRIPHTLHILTLLLSLVPSSLSGYPPSSLLPLDSPLASSYKRTKPPGNRSGSGWSRSIDICHWLHANKHLLSQTTSLTSTYCSALHRALSGPSQQHDA